MSKIKRELEEAIQYITDRAINDLEQEILDPYYIIRKAEECRRYSEAMRPLQDAEQK